MRASLVRLWTFLVIAAGVIGSPPASALDVEGHEWGFDGRIVPMSFNLLTIQVRNNSPTAFDGNVALQEGSSIARNDLPLVERQLYIEPFGSRRLQFFPFVTQHWSEYTLAWGQKSDESVEISRQTSSPLRMGTRAVVLLRDASMSRPFRSKLATFDESDFPISAAGMDSLRGLVLDHVPRWDALRLQALRDWIGGGGELHLLKMETGEYPAFPPPLEVLNEPSDLIAFGNGRIFHHPIKVSEISDDFVASTLGIRHGPEDNNNLGNNYQYQHQGQTPDQIAQLLRGLTRPNHNWGLIYFLSFIYLLVVFPGCWLLGRRRADFRISYPALLGAVFLFSMAFKTVGQRGYGEETAWNAVGTARRVAPGRFLTEAFSNAFVTSGGMYSYKHGGEGQIYSSGGSNDTRRGECFNRPNSGIEIEIPPFSSQTFMHTEIVSAPDFNVDFTTARVSGPSIELEARLTGEIPAVLHSMYAVYGNQRLNLTRAGNVLTASGPSPLSNFASNQNYGAYSYPRYNSSETNPILIYQSAEIPLVVRNLWLSNSSRDGNELRLPDGIVRVFLYADMPSQFLEVAGGPEKRQGRLLYIFEHPVDR